MKIDLLSPIAVFVAGQDGYHTYRIPAVVVSATGAILAFCEGRRDSQGDQGVIDLLLKRSTDCGLSWSAQQVVYRDRSEPDITIGNPCPIVDPDSAVIHLLFTRNNTRLFYTCSRDDGQSWAEPVEHTSILKNVDFPVKRIATGPVHGVRTRARVLIAPIWVCDRSITEIHQGCTDARYRAGTICSRDNGRTWAIGELTPDSIPNQNECTVAEREDGSLLLNIRAHRHGCRVQAISTDGGLTWSMPVSRPDLPCPTCQAALLSGSGNSLFFVNPAVSYTGSYSADSRRNLTLRRSTDGGLTWLEQAVLLPGSAGYSDLAWVPDGNLLCLAESGRNDYQEKIVCLRITVRD